VVEGARDRRLVELFTSCMNNSPRLRRERLRAAGWSICSCLT
jgi:hypothetical protein